MGRTFAQYLELISESSRNISPELFDRLTGKATAYAEKSLRVHKLELLVSHKMDGERALRPTIDKVDMYSPYHVHASGKPNGINAFAFLMRTPLWIVSADKNEEILAKVNSYQDLWSDACPDELPHFRRFEAKARGLEGQENTRTLISIPVEVSHNAYSVVYFECKERLQPNERAIKELLTLAFCISLLKVKADAYTAKSHRISKSLQRLEKIAFLEDFFEENPFFLGYSERSDKRVIAAIHKALDKNKIAYTDWAYNFETGDIRTQTFQHIMKCKAGLLYLSEPSAVTDGSQYYSDNLNVLFEAGMLQCRALQAKPLAEFNSGLSFFGWLGIREKNSNSLPFDLAGERVIYVNRLKDGTLLENELEVALDRFLTTMLSAESKHSSSSDRF